MKEIILTQGKVALVDDEDYEYLNQFNWFASKNFNTYYATRGTRKDGKKVSVPMHRVILNVSTGKHIDHINHDGLDNRKINLRICTISQNQHNQRLHTGLKSSVYKGVHWSKKSKKWQSRVGFMGKRIYVGQYDSEKDAAKAYDLKAIEYFGEFAKTNFGRE